MKYHDLVVEREGPLVTVALNRPEALNALSLCMLRELKDIALSFQDDPSIRVVVLTGGSNMFSAGMDLKDPEVKGILSGSMSERRKQVTLGPLACKAWEETPAVTICAIEGFCIGGGVSLAISCDFRVMSASAFMRIPEIDLGLNYSWGSLPRLVHLIGPAKTKAMTLFCEPVSSDKCLSWGLAEEKAADGGAVEAGLAMAEKVMKRPPIPVAMTKQAISHIAGAMDRASIYMDADQFVLTSYSRDHEEGTTAFLEKRPPQFKGE